MDNSGFVFVSYSHDTPEHRLKVGEFIEEMRAAGLKVRWDQDVESPPEGWPKWMVSSLRDAVAVLLVCTKTYLGRFEGSAPLGEGRGAKWEGAIATQYLYEDEAHNKKWIPVCVSESDLEHIPMVLKGATRYVIFNSADRARLIHRLKSMFATEQAPVPGTRGRLLVTNLPFPRNPFFTGREGILSQIRGALLANRSAALNQPMALSGLGGVGKTQTAVEFAYRYASEYDYVLWVQGDSPDSIRSGFVTLSETLDIPERTAEDISKIVKAVKEWLATHERWLLVIDNADLPAIISDFVPLNHKGHIIITSRAQVFHSIGIASPIALEEMTAEEAIGFLERRTGRKLDDVEELSAANKLSEELGYLPLALEQAGAFIAAKQAAFRDYLNSYREYHLKLLEQSPPVAGKYPASVATTWDMNFREVAQISPAAIEVLELGAFLHSSGIPFELLGKGAPEFGGNLREIKNIQEDPLAINILLEPLTSYSLVRLQPTARTFEIHRLVQEVIKDRMDTGKRAEWALRLAKGFALAFPRPEFSNWPTCERLVAHARATLRLCESSKLEEEPVSRLANELGSYLEARAVFSEAEHLGRLAAGILRKLGGHPLELSASLNNIAIICKKQGRFDEAEALYKEAIELNERVTGSSHGLIAKLGNLGSLYHALGKTGKAKPLFLRALELANQYDEPLWESRILQNLAMLHVDEGKIQKAREHTMRALSIRREFLTPDHPDIGTSILRLAEIERKLGNHSEATKLLEEAAANKKIGLGEDHPDFIQIHRLRLHLAIDSGDATKAVDEASRAVDLSTRYFPLSPETMLRRLELVHALMVAGDRPGARKEAVIIHDMLSKTALSRQVKSRIAQGLVGAFTKLGDRKLALSIRRQFRLSSS
jgi:tetratricopeptide (TPR) repeat protein